MPRVTTRAEEPEAEDPLKGLLDVSQTVNILEELTRIDIDKWDVFDLFAEGLLPYEQHGLKKYVDPKHFEGSALGGLAKRLEEVALKDPYFIDHNLYPNIDFYSGILLRAIGIPSNMFTVMFAIGRLPGWISQWKESMETPHWKMQRPRQIYIGSKEREYVPLEKRVERLRAKYAGNPEAQALLDSESQEIDLYRKYGEWYGYEFFVMKKTED